MIEKTKSGKMMVWKRNPHRPGSYHDLFNWMMEQDNFTRKEFMDYAEGGLGMDFDLATYAVTIMMSPRERSIRGDCRGNVAAMGHLYYLDKLQRFTKEEKQRYRFYWRDSKLESRKRVKHLELESEKLDKKNELEHSVVH